MMCQPRDKRQRFQTGAPPGSEVCSKVGHDWGSWLSLANLLNMSGWYGASSWRDRSNEAKPGYSQHRCACVTEQGVSSRAAQHSFIIISGCTRSAPTTMRICRHKPHCSRSLHGVTLHTVS